MTDDSSGIASTKGLGDERAKPAAPTPLTNASSDSVGSISGAVIPEAIPAARQVGDQETRFHGSARIQVTLEYVYLALMTLVSLFLLFWVITHISGPATEAAVGWFEASLRLPPVALIAALFFSGMIGGCAFAMKWLYHSVAKNSWFKDRLWWRLSVPWMGGLLGVFANFIFSRTLGTSFDATALVPYNLFPALGLSFLVGVFADGVLASLEKLARKIFGTLNELGGP